MWTNYVNAAYRKSNKYATGLRSDVLSFVLRDNVQTNSIHSFCLQLHSFFYRAAVATQWCQVSLPLWHKSRCRAGGQACGQLYYDSNMELLLWPFRAVATITGYDPHDANQITGRGSGRMGYYAGKSKTFSENNDSDHWIQRFKRMKCNIFVMHNQMVKIQYKELIGTAIVSFNSRSFMMRIKITN
jgi:hypothetical protein